MEKIPQNPAPKTSKLKRLVLLDAHAILHRAYHALPDFATAKGEPTGALYGLSAMLLKIVTDLKPDYVVACYDVKGPTHRHDVFKEYKAQRKKAEDDLIAQMIRSRDIFTAFDIPIYDKQGFEADDILGTIVEQTKDRNDLEIIIASGDMDTMQLINDGHVRVYTLKKGISDTIMYDEKAVNDRYGFGPELVSDYKGLCGDPSDNIPGVKGIGDKTATTLIQTFGTIENVYRELEAGHEDKFEKAGVKARIVGLLKENKEEAEFSKMLATIRRNVPIEFKLPEKTFKEGVDVQKITALWNELEFRTLPQRLKTVLEGKKRPEESHSEEHSQREQTSKILLQANCFDCHGVLQSEIPQVGSSNQLQFGSNIDPEELEKTALALWLVNSNVTDPKLEDILNFANTEDFKTAKEAIFTELDKRKVRKVYEEIELPLIPVRSAMETRGIKIDRVVLAKLGTEYHATVDKLQKKIWELAGVEFNINSPKQLGEVLFDKMGLAGKNMKKTAGGARSTRESELEKLRDTHEIVPLLFEYRELQKLLSTYIDAIPPLLDENNRLHTRFVQTGTTTGRMSSQNPNLQNIPMRTELGRAIRKAFVAPDGFVLAGLDYSQMELRIAAFMSGDEKMIDIFRKGEDVHRAVASAVFKVPQDKVDPEMRRRAKVINFGIIYGMGVLALKQNLGTSREEAQNFYNDYFKEFSTLAKYLDEVKAETALRGYTETFYGRRRYFEGIKSKIPYIRAQAERMAINAPIQGTEADVIKLAMIRVQKYIQDEKLEKDVFPLLQVHDELIYEIKKDKAVKVSVEIEKIMKSVMDPKDTKGVVLEAKGSIGNDWGELK
ncbi:MAG: DNA polymerase [Candidatus Taylorbacteria bacterium]|nr:DNA polymerase [Candidatus Taylorbacteria bacterium]